jgi:hypothetical protein
MITRPTQPAAGLNPATYAEQAERYLEWDARTDPGARAITAALLYVGAAIEAAAERQADDIDTVAALLDDRLTSIEAVIDPAFLAAPPLWRRVLGCLRAGPAGPAGAGQDTPAGSEVGDPDGLPRDTKPGYRPPRVQEAPQTKQAPAPVIGESATTTESDRTR